MEPQIIILHPQDEERALLKAAIQEAVDWDCIELSDEQAATQWLKHNTRPVGAVFIGGDEDRFHRLIQLFRWHEASRSSLIYRLVDFFEQGWAASLSDLGDVVDRILVKPVTPPAIRDRLGLLWKRKGALGGDNVLVFDDAPSASAVDRIQLRDSLSSLFSDVRVVNEFKEVLARLEENPGQRKLVVCHWEMPSRRGAELLRRLNLWVEAKKSASGTAFEVETLIVTSRASVDQMCGLQQAASEVSGELIRPLQPGVLSRQILPILRRIMKQQRADSFLREATLFISREKYDYASDILDHAVRTIPDIASLFGGLGGVLFARGGGPSSLGYAGVGSVGGKGSLTRAASAYEMALRLEPMRSRWAVKCLETYVALGRTEEGIRVAKRSLLRFPFNDSLRTRLAQVYLQNGDSLGARIELRRALLIRPSSGEASTLLRQLEPFGSMKTAA